MSNRKRSAKHQPQKRNETDQERDTRESVASTIGLTRSVRNWYYNQLAEWHKHVRLAAVRARELASGLRDGSVPSPPWPEEVLDSSTSAQARAELYALLDLLDASAQLDERIAGDLRSLLDNAQVGGRRPSETWQVQLADVLKVEDRLLGRAARSDDAVQNEIDQQLDAYREPGSLRKLRKSQNKPRKK